MLKQGGHIVVAELRQLMAGGVARGRSAWWGPAKAVDAPDLPSPRASAPAPRESGFTLIELLVSIAVLGVVSAVAVLNIGVFLGAGTDEAYQLEQRNVQTAVLAYLVDGNTIESEFVVCPGAKGVLTPYLLGNLKYCWLVTTDGKVVPVGVVPPLYHSDFESMQGLRVLQGNWYLEDGVLKPQTNIEHRILVDGGPWDDFHLSVMATYLDGAYAGGGYGIYYRANDEPALNSYVFQFDVGYDGGSFIVRPVVNGREQSAIARIKMADVFGPDWVANSLRDEHQVQIEVRGDRHVITIDGTQVLGFTNDRFGGGTVGFRTWHASDVEFGEITVTE